MRRFIVLALLLVSFQARADSASDSANFQYRDGAFVTGYAFASLVDMAHKDPMTSKHAVGKKIALGLLGGLAIAVGHVSTNNEPLQFAHIVFGGLGGLTCTIIHF